MTMRRLRRPLLTALLATLLVAVSASVALAAALVVVEVRTPEGEPADGTVTLTPKGGGESHSCTTEGGKCKIDGVEGGRYEVSLDPNKGEAPPSRTVMIPPSGRVSLIVSTK